MPTFDTYESIDSLKSIFPDIYSGQDSNSFFISFVRDHQSLEYVTRPFCFNGFLLVFCIDGKAQLNVDQVSYVVESYKTLIVLPGAVVSVSDMGDRVGFNLTFLALTTDTIDQLPVDFKNALPPETLIYKRAVVELTPQIFRLVRTQIFLADSVSVLDGPFSDDIARCMYSIIFFILMSLMITPVKGTKPYKSPRTHVLLSRFVQLLKDNFKKHRDISFYAEELGVSTNYLSQRLKFASGHNASEWIDSYLLSESKNLLRLTAKPVQAIAAELNFSGQASFAKYFKEKTGMTPSQFRRR